MADISARLDAGHSESLPFPHLTGYWVNRLGARSGRRSTGSCASTT